MALDIWVFGPGFGESILMVWDATPQNGGIARRAAFVDCHGGKLFDEHPGIVQWGNEGCPDVAWVGITHPHEDHIRNASTMMSVAGCAADTILWWGGHDMSRLDAFYAKLSEDVRLRNEPLGRLAPMTASFLQDLIQLQRQQHKCRRKAPSPIILAPSEITPAVYQEETPKGQLTVNAISSWLEPQKAYTSWVDRQIRRNRAGQPVIFPKPGDFNSTSLGLLIQYGRAQILLGGDMESDNWKDFYNAHTDAAPTSRHKGKLPALNPCLIKVSHHGSKTGTIPQMWPRRRGFFGSKTSPSQTAQHCVITPWRRGGRERQLPDSNVVQTISEAGCHVWETASADDARGVDAHTLLADSFVHFQIDAAANTAICIAEQFCRCTRPAS